MPAPGLRDAALDLLLGSTCVGCGRPGRVLCRGCEGGLPRGGTLCWPTPSPPGLAPPHAAGPYDGVLKAMVNAHKEHRVLALAGPLGQVLADVVVDAVVACRAADPDARSPVLLVPVPSRGAVVRRRGHDPLLRVTRHASARLRRRGVPATVARLLVPRGAVRDQALLGAADRAENLRGTMCARAVGSVPPVARVLVVDDVLTTGATVREAQRALEQGGVAVLAVATVAATARRRHPSDEGVGYRSERAATTVSPWSPSGSVVASPDRRAGGPLVPTAWHPDG